MRVPSPLTSGKLCPSCKGTGADIARTLAAPASSVGYIRCRPCNGNGLDPAEYFRWSDQAPTPAFVDTCLETAYGTTTRLPFQIRVF
jgi:hypothetical protein